MTQIVVRDAIERQLAAATSAVEVCGATGQLLGLFIPSQEDGGPPLDDPEVDETELRRRFAQGGGRSLRGILQDLESGA